MTGIAGRFDRWLPAAARGNPEARLRYALVFAFAAFEMFVTSFVFVTELVWGTPALGFISAIAVVAIFAVLIGLVRGGDVDRSACALIVVLFTAVTAINFSTAGRSLGANISLPTLVLFAILISTPRVGVLWTILTVVQILAVAYLKRSGYEPPINPDPEWVKSATDRVPLFFSLGSAVIGVLIQHALQRYRNLLQEAHTAQTVALTAAESSATRFNDFAEIAADGFWETDAELRLTYVSPSFAHAIGLAVSQMLGHTPDSVWRKRFPSSPDLASFIEPMRNRRVFDNQRLSILGDDGVRRLLLNQGRPAYDHSGRFSGYRGVVRDITAQDAAERAVRSNERRLRLVTDNLPALVAYIDHDQRYRFANAAIGRTFGVDPASMIGRSMREVRGEAVYALLAEHVDAVLRGELVNFEGKAPGKDRDYYFQSNYVPDIDGNGNVRGFYAMTFDITPHKDAELRLAAGERRLRLITDNLPVLIAYIDTERTFRFNNSTYEKWLQRPLDEITGRRLSEVYSVDTYAEIEPFIERALAGEHISFELEPKDTRARHVHVTYVPDVGPCGKVLGIYGLIHDVTAVKQIESQLRTLAQFDALTGLPNRNRYNDKLIDAIARSERSGQLMALMFLDLDHFKSINDSLGHNGGDQVLQEFGRRLTGSVRQVDTVARLAGDEFVIILEGLHAPDEAAVVAHKILQAMAPPFAILGHSKRLSTSIGVAIRRAGEIDGASLLKRADEALYAAKASGRGVFRLVE
ncbi:MAG: PAS domain-containing protein [Pseudomarimonas sp.]